MGAGEPGDARTPIAEANNAFAFDLYMKLAADKKQEGKNLFFSPSSITTALGMVVEGARGETAEQMGTILRYPAAWRRAGADAKTLNETLIAMGMPQAFESGMAQFEGISATRELYIGLVQHDAFVDVNEKGTEAAAATVISMMAGSAPPSTWPFVPNFRADRPFVFLIRDRVTRVILFVGRVLKPEV